MAEVTPVTLLIGVAGAGKARLPDHLLQQLEAARVGVVTARPEPVMRWNAGCACCAPRDDVSRSLRALLPRARRDEMLRVVIETTGLADPVPILAALLSDSVAASAYRLDGIVTVVDASDVVDASNGTAALDTRQQAVVAMADRIVLTGTGSAERLCGRLRRINPGVPIMHAPDGVADSAAILNAGLSGPAPDLGAWLAADALATLDGLAAGALAEDRLAADGLAADKLADAIGSCCCTLRDPLPWPAVSAWLERLVRLHGDAVLRLKAILRVRDRPGPMVIHGTRHLLFPPLPLAAWPVGDTRRSRLALIGRGLPWSDLRESLADLAQAAEAG